MNDHYFFVTSTESIYDRVLPMIEEKAKIGKVYIYTGSKEIKQFFDTYTDYPATLLPFNISFITKRTWYTLLPQLFLLKKFKNKTESLEGNYIYFFTSGCYVSLYSLIQFLAKKNIVYYQPAEKFYAGQKQTRFKDKLAVNIINLFLGIDVFMSKFGEAVYPQLSASFFKNNNINSIPYKELNLNSKKEIAQQIYKKINELQGKEILFIEEPQDIINQGRIEDVELSASSDLLYEMLEKHKNTTIVKQHQKKFNGYGKMDLLDTVPNFIPAEFILLHPWKMIIGIESSSLATATRFNNAKVISLIDMFYYGNETISDELKKLFDEYSSRKILLPNTIEDLKEIIEDE